MTTLDELVGLTKRKLSGVSGRSRSLTLDGNINDSTTTALVVEQMGGDIRPGALMGIDYELLDVTDTDTPSFTLTVQRGALETTPTSHLSGTSIEVEPTWPRQVVLDALVDEVRSLPRTVWREEPITVSFPAGSTTVDIAGATGLDIVRDRALRLDVQSPINGSWPIKELAGRVIRNQDTGTYASGYALDVSPIGFGLATDVRATFAVAFDVDTLTAATDLQAGCGLPSSLNDVIVFGAGARLLLDPENLRLATTQQGQPRDAQEVPPGSWLRAATMWDQRKMIRLAEEERRLLAKWGI